MADYNSAYTGVQIDENIALAATAVQDADLATVATTGAYTDLSGRPTLGTAAATASTDYATAAQGALADTAVQPADDAADLGSGAATDGYVLTADGAGGAAWEAAAGGGGTPGGTDTQVQFNDDGAFGGDGGFTFDKTNNTLGLGGGTITASDPIIDMAQTWNNGAVAFTAIKLNVTDTASASGSLLMDLQVGGSSRFRADKTGTLFSAGAVWINGTTNSGIAYEGFKTVVYHEGSPRVVAGFSNVSLVPTDSFGWRNAAGISATVDVILARDAANTLGQRNGVNAQAFNLYNTYTDASNYERGFMRFVSNTLRIGTEKLGTGTARALEFHTDGVARLTINAAGTIFDATASQVNFSTGTRLHVVSNGTFGITNSGNAAGSLAFGAVGLDTTSRLKPSGTTLQVRRGDDTAFTNIQGKLTTDTAYTAGAPTATGYLVLFDGNGTAYKVPAEAL